MLWDERKDADGTHSNWYKVCMGADQPGVATGHGCMFYMPLSAQVSYLIIHMQMVHVRCFLYEHSYVHSRGFRKPCRTGTSRNPLMTGFLEDMGTFRISIYKTAKNYC